MIKRAVIRAPARGYVDGRFIGEEKEPSESGANTRGKGRGKAGAGRRGKSQGDSVLSGDNIGNTTAKRRPRSGAAGGKARTAGGAAAGAAGGRNRAAGGAPAGQGARAGVDGRKRPQGGAQGQGQRQSQGRDPNRVKGRGQGQGQGQRGSALGGAGTAPFGTNPFVSEHDAAPRGAGRTKQRRGSTGKKSPFRTGSAITGAHAHPFTQEFSPTQGSDLRRLGDEAKSGQFAEALAASANVKRERLHKVLAQSGHGSRRDMEIMISSGRVMVNGIVATTGTQVAPGDNVLIDQRHVKLKFTEDMPRVLLYHKPEGEIVTTNDPGNRITVFDNLPRVETGKWVAVGRLDINTSGLLIFTTSGELANRFMHPRYEVEREYAVRILGELTEEQTKQLLTGVKIEESSKAAGGSADDDDDRFNRVDGDNDNDDNLEEDIYEFDDDETSAPNVGNSAAAPHGSGNGSADGNGNGNGNVLSHHHDDEHPINRHSSDDDQPIENHPFENQPVHNAPLDARFLGNASAPAAFARNELAKFDVIEKRGGEGVNQWYHVVIREGRNREVRKMFESLGLTVSRLIRTRFGKVELPPRLLRGKMIELDENQVRSVLASAGMKVEGPVAPLSSRGKNAGPRGAGERQGEKRSGRDGLAGPVRPAGLGARAPRDPNRQRDPNQARRQNQTPRLNADGTPFVGAEHAGVRGPNNNRGRRNGRGGERNKVARAPQMGVVGKITDEGMAGSDGLPSLSDTAGDAAPDQNRTRGRSNIRGGRGRRSSGPRRDPAALSLGSVDATVEGSGHRADGAQTGPDQPNAGAGRTDNRPRGKSRRTFRGRRNARGSEGGNDGGNNAGGDVGGNAGNGGGNDSGGGNTE